MEENAAIVSFEDLHGLISTPDISKRLKVKNKETKQPRGRHFNKQNGRGHFGN